MASSILHRATGVILSVGALALVWGLLALAGWAVMGWMPTFFKEQFKLDQGAAGISATSFLAVANLRSSRSSTIWYSVESSV